MYHSSNKFTLFVHWIFLKVRTLIKTISLTYLAVREKTSYFNFATAASAAKSLQSCPTLCYPMDGSPPGSPVPWDSPGKNTGVGCRFLLQCIKVKRTLFSLNYLVVNKNLKIPLLAKILTIKHSALLKKNNNFSRC